MKYKISKKGKQLVRMLITTAENVVRPVGHPNDLAIRELAQDDLQTYITSLETELAALKAELERYEWQSGKPKVAGEYWVVVKNLEGEKVNSMDYWHGTNWRYYGWRDGETGELGSNILAWSEIRPFEKGE